MIAGQPRIGLTVDVFKPIPDWDDAKAVFGSYVDAVEDADAIPLGLPGSRDDRKSIDRTLDNIDGLLCTGTSPVPAAMSRFRKGTTPGVEGADTRSDVDVRIWHLIRRAGERRIPVLGICWGAQLINDVYDGTWGEVDGHLAANGRPTTTTITLRPGTWLSELHDTLEIEVPCMHYWCMQTLGSELMSCARSTDGLDEAFHHRALPVWGTLYHADRDPQQRVIRWFVEQCREPEGRTEASLVPVLG